MIQPNDSRDVSSILLEEIFNRSTFERGSVKNESFLLFNMAWREAIKKPVAKPTAPKPKFVTKDDDWETDINYEVDKIFREYSTEVFQL